MKYYRHSVVDVVAMMNQVMTGFAPNHAIVIFTDYVDNGLAGFLKR